MEDALCLGLLLSAMRHSLSVNQPYSLDLSISFWHFSGCRDKQPCLDFCRWVLGIWTQVFMPEEQILLTQSHVLHPLFPLYLYVHRAKFSSRSPKIPSQKIFFKLQVKLILCMVSWNICFLIVYRFYCVSPHKLLKYLFQKHFKYIFKT